MDFAPMRAKNPMRNPRGELLMLAQADVNELARQLHLALFLDGQLILWEL
jgi:hypothetical protein